MKKVRKSPEDTFYCVSRTYPRWFPQWKDSHYLSLAPSKDLLDAHKKGHVFWNEYEKLFLEEIRSSPEALALLKAIWKHAQSKDVYLVCWEKTDTENMLDTRCHTCLLINLAEDLASDENWTC